MRAIIFILFLLFVNHSITSQEKSLSGTLSYPATIGENYGNKFTGVADVGFQMRFMDIKPVYFGFSMNVSYLANSIEVDQQKVNEFALILQPRLFVEINSSILYGFRPSLGWGYTLVRSNELSSPFSSTTDVFSYSGFNYNAGISYDLNNLWFLTLQYDLVTFNYGTAPIDDISGEKMNMLKFGVGMRF